MSPATLRVLVVDDNPDCVHAAASFLRGLRERQPELDVAHAFGLLTKQLVAEDVELLTEERVFAFGSPGTRGQDSLVVKPSGLTPDLWEAIIEQETGLPKPPPGHMTVVDLRTPDRQPSIVPVPNSQFQSDQQQPEKKKAA